MIRVLVFAGILLLGSCSKSASNERLVLGGRYKTASFDGGGASVVDLDQSPRSRELWASTIVVAPTDGTITGHTLRTPVYLNDKMPPRRYGLFPTLQTALVADKQGWFADLFLSFDQIGRSFGEVLLMPYRGIVYPLVEPRTWSPERTWKRTNQSAPSSWSSAQPRKPLLEEDYDHDAND
jgi:hypothetical protein